MDVSVLAAVGSFVVSERVLKPKATALFILGCLLAYDLTSKTHDLSSLRVYRGTVIFVFCFDSDRSKLFSFLSFILLVFSVPILYRSSDVGVYFDDGCLVITYLEAKWCCMR